MDCHVERDHGRNHAIYEQFLLHRLISVSTIRKLYNYRLVSPFLLRIASYTKQKQPTPKHSIPSQQRHLSQTPSHSQIKPTKPNITTKMQSAGFYVLSASSPPSGASSAAQSRRASAKSNSSIDNTNAATLPEEHAVQTEKRRSSLRKVWDYIRPYEVATAADGVYERRGSAPQGLHKEKKSQPMKWNPERAQYELFSAAA